MENRLRAALAGPCSHPPLAPSQPQHAAVCCCCSCLATTPPAPPPQNWDPQPCCGAGVAARSRWLAGAALPSLFKVCERCNIYHPRASGGERVFPSRKGKGCSGKREPGEEEPSPTVAGVRRCLFGVARPAPTPSAQVLAGNLSGPQSPSNPGSVCLGNFRGKAMVRNRCRALQGGEETHTHAGVTAQAHSLFLECKGSP